MKDSLPLKMCTEGFPHGSHSKEYACNEGGPGSIIESEDPLDKGMATYSSVLARHNSLQL